MALHEIPDGQGEQHQRDEQCPCKPAKAEGYRTIGTGRNRHPYRGVIFTHQELPATPDDVADLPEVDELREAPCGHLVVDGEHHQIPDDGAPHAPTSECGCGPQLDSTTTHVVYVHPDQGFDEGTEQLYREVFGA